MRCDGTSHDAERNRRTRTLAESHPERNQWFLAQRSQKPAMPGLGRDVSSNAMIKRPGLEPMQDSGSGGAARRSACSARSAARVSRTARSGRPAIP